MPCQITLPAATAARLRMARRLPDFGQALEALPDDQVVDAARVPQLRLLCWNRASLLLTAREDFDLYEANWRFVEPAAFEPAEAALVATLANRFGGEILNVRVAVGSASPPSGGLGTGPPRSALPGPRGLARLAHRGAEQQSGAHRAS